MKPGSRLGKIVPAIGWLRGYRSGWIGADLIAGLVVWALIVPESMAYAGIAGVPVQFGLYSVPLAVVAYMLLGTSRQLFVGPSSTVAVLAASTVAPLAAAGSDQYIALMAVLSLVVGLLYVVFGLLRMGFIARFFAKPVLDGFIVGLGIFIAVGQLHKIVGVSQGSGDTVRQFAHVFAEFGSWNWPTVAVGVSALVILFALARYAKKVPGALAVVVLGILGVHLFDLGNDGVALVGSVPTGFNFVSWTGITWADIGDMVPGALGIIVVGYAQSVAIAKSYAAQHNYQIDPNQELIAYGAASMGAGVLQGYTPTGSLSKSAAAQEAGGKSPLMMVFTAAFVVLTVLFIAGVFQDLPEAVLGAIVIHAVSGMIDFSKLTRLYRAHTPDFLLALGAFLGVILIGILAGIVIGVVLSLVLLIHRLDHPHGASLGRTPDGTRFGDIADNADVAPVPGAFIYRLDAPLIFVNADVVVDDIEARLRGIDPPPQTLIIDFESVEEVDTTGVDAIVRLHNSLSTRGVELALARVHSEVHAYMERDGFIDVVGSDRIFSTLALACEAVSPPPPSLSKAPE
jgi:high affinity sulfate transporter 1